MQKIYKSCSAKYTDEQIRNIGGTNIFVSFEQLLRTPLYEAMKKQPNEKMVGMEISYDGIKVYIETEK